MLIYYYFYYSISKITVLPSGTLPQTLDLENFATASRCCQQNSSTVELVDRTYDGRYSIYLVHRR